MSIFYKLKVLFDDNHDYLNELISHNDFVKKMPELLKRHKAIHLRPIEYNENLLDNFDENHFCQNVLDCNLEEFKYVGGAAPRKLIKVEQNKDVIFTSNEAPKDKIIPFHHELGQTDNPPAYLAFYCKKNALKFGETPLMDSSLIYRYINENHQEFEEKLRTYGVRYRRVLPSEDDKESPLGRSWKNTYNVESKDELENILDYKKGVEYSWLEDNNLEVISDILPAIFYNEETHEHEFYNSIIAAYEGWEDSRNNRLESIIYGNGDKMDFEVLDNISKFIESKKISWKWLEGDIIWIDNRQVLHSRNRYEGERSIYASLWNRPLNEKKKYKMIGCRGKIDFKISFGLWKVDKKKAKEVTYNAIKTGYRKLDCACDYGNEKEVGDGIKMALDEGLCKREDLHITSKLWNTYHDVKHVFNGFKKSLDDLQLEYLDLYLIHFPISLEYVDFDKKYPPEWVNLENKMILKDQDLTLTWIEMEKIYEMKLARQIGVSNFNSSLLRQIVNTSIITPHAIQIELHPLLSQNNMLKLCKGYGMDVIAYSPLGARSYLELNMAKSHEDLLDNEIINKLGIKYNKSAVQILLRWAVQRNTTPICKSSSINHMKENINIFNFRISDSDMEKVNKLNINKRFNDPGVFCLEAFGTFCPIYD